MTENGGMTLDEDGALEVGGIEADQLRGLIERIEQLEDEKSAVADHIRELYAEAKSTGFDPKIIRKVVRLRKMDPREVDAEETLVHLYKRALGMA